MSAFAHAWQLLKALEEDKGLMGTLPPSIRQLLRRERERAGESGRGDVRHFDVAGTNEAAMMGDGEGAMGTSSRPVEMGPGRGELIEPNNLKVSRDISPLQEMQPTMISHSPRGSHGYAAGSGGTSMMNVRGHDTMPEESFHTPIEASRSRKGMEQAAGRMLTGGQRGGRMDTRGGGRSGLNLPLRGEKDGGPVSPDLRVARRGAERQKFGRARSAANLGNVEGVQVGAKLGGASNRFVNQPEDRAPTQQERIASILQGMGDITMEPEAEPQGEPEVPRNEKLRPMGARYNEKLDVVRQGEKPNLDFSTEDDYANTTDMFQNPGSPESLDMRERLLQFARQKGGVDGSAQQGTIDRSA